MRKRILYGNPTAVHGGAEEVLLTFMQASRELGYEPLLLVPETGWLTDQCREEKIGFTCIPSIPDPFHDSAWYQFRPWLLNALRIARLVSRQEVAIVHSNTPRVSYHCGLAARLARVPSVVHVHNAFDLPYAVKSKAWLLDKLADRTIAVSHAVEEAVIGVCPSLSPRIDTVYNGRRISAYGGVKALDLRQAHGFPADALVVGSVSTMTPWKGQDVLIEAFGALRRARPEARLLIVGAAHREAVQAAHEAALHQKVAGLGLGDAVVFTGWREDALNVIRSLDIFVHVPVKPDPLPTVALHASALERPIIASRIGGIPEIVEDGVTGILVNPGDPGELAAALQRVAGDAALRQKIGRAARIRFADVFSWEQMCDGLEKVYRRCLSARRMR